MVYYFDVMCQDDIIAECSWRMNEIPNATGCEFDAAILSSAKNNSFWKKTNLVSEWILFTNNPDFSFEVHTRISLLHNAIKALVKLAYKQKEAVEQNQHNHTDRMLHFTPSLASRQRASVDGKRTGSFPTGKAQRHLVENSWNKFNQG